MRRHRTAAASRRRHGITVLVVTLTLGLTGPERISPAAAAGPGAAAALPTGPGVTYAHDANGRVTAAFDPTGDGARIGYDAVGNITGITRLPATTLAVAQVSPPAAPVGASVDVFATRLGTAPAAVTVSFGAASAHPTAIVGNKATVTVPSGATSGAVTVAVGGQSASWPGFAVISRPAPTITGISAVVADRGAAVTVTGTRFEPTASDNRVDVNGTKVPVRSATATTLTLGMPAVQLGGRVRVTTPDGTASSTSDLIVPPSPHLAADVGSAIRVATGATSTLSISQPQRIGLALFDVPAGARAAVTLSGATFGSTYASHVWGPDFRALAGADATTGTTQYTLDPRSTDTTYEVVVDPQETQTGSVQVSVQTGIDQVATVTVDGPAATLSTTVPLTQARFRLQGRAGQRVLARLSGSTSPTVTVDAWLLSPTGARLQTRTDVGSPNVLNGIALAADGTYTVVVATRSPGTLTYTVSVATAAANPTATATIDGASGSLTFGAVGQLGTVTFTGSVDQRIWVRYQTTFTVPFSPGTFYSLAGPDGSILVPEQVTTVDDNTFARVITLPLTGIYTVYVDPIAQETGSSTVSVTTVPADATIAAAVDGQPHSAAVSHGQQVAATFAGTAGQRVSATIDSSWSAICDTNWILTQPDGTTLDSDTCSRFVDTVTLPVTGTYRLALALNGRSSGTLTVTVYPIPPDATGAAFVGGAAVTVTTTTPGQNASLTFSIVPPPSRRVYISCSLQPATTSGVQFRLLAPNGTALAEPFTTCSSPTLVDTITLSARGTYTITIDPVNSRYTGAFTLQLYSVPADATAAATVGGPAVRVETTGPGQNGAITFTGVANQVVSAKVTATTYPTCRTTTKLISPSGATLWTQACPSVNATNTATLPVAGTYTITVDPSHTDIGSVSYQLIAGAAGAAGPRRRQPEPDGAGPSTSESRGPASAPARPKVQPPLWSYHVSTSDDRLAVLAGTVRRTDGRPLARVTLRIDDQVTRTDRVGRFRLTGLPHGTRVLLIDGRSASRGSVRYGMFSVQAQLRRGTNVLPYTPYLPVLDTAHEVAIDSPTRREVVLTNPGIPGLEVHIPRGVTVTDADGRPVHRLGVTPIPVSRTPIPMPRGVRVPVYFTVQPAGGSLHGGAARVVYPNYLRQKPGTPVNFWHYEKAGGGWEVYGGGRVDGHARQVQPNPGTVLYDFDGAMINADGWLGDLLRPLKEATGADGDPVDLGSGLFQLTQTDLATDDVLPLALTRAYNSGSGRTRAVGIGMHHNYDLYLSSANQYQEADLNLADGTQVHYVRTSPGTSFSDAIMAAAPAPTDFAGSTLAWNGNGWDLTMTDGTTLVFGDVAPLQSIRDRYGNETRIIRNHLNFFGSYEGDVVSVRSTSGFWLSFSYGATSPDGRSLLTRVDDSAGRNVRYGYDAAGHLTSVTDPGDGITRYGYDPGGRLATVTDARQKTYLTNEYDTNGRVHKQTVAGGTYTFDYTLTGTKVSQATVTNPLGRIRTVSYDSAGYLVSDTQAVGTLAEQRLRITRDPTTHIPTDVVDPLGHTIHSSYDAGGRPLSSTHAVGTPSALSSSATYAGPFHQPDTITDTAGKITRLSYDPAGNLMSGDDPLHHGGSVTYRPDGQPDTVTSPTHDTTRFGYADGQLTSVTDPLGRRMMVFRDAANRPSVVTGPSGLRSTTRYDAANLVRQTTDAGGAATSYDYDENGDLTRVTDAKSHFTSFRYDDFGRVQVRTDPVEKTDSYTYDLLGNVTTHTDRRGLVTEYRYDELDRLTFVGYGRTGTAPNFSYESTVSYQWDRADRLMLVTDSAAGAGTLTYGYDDLDRVTSRTDARGTTGYRYDAGRLARTLISGQPDTIYGYDDASRLTTVTKGTQSAAYTLDEAGRVRVAALPGGVSTSTEFDPAGQLSSLTYRRGSATLGDLSYQYNSAGQRDGIFGSWVRLSLPADESGAVYDAADRLTAVSGRTLSYDDAGNLTADGPTTYAWNARGELTGATDPSGPATLGYGADGQLARVTRGGADTLFRYDGGDLVGQQSGAAVTSYLPSPLGDGALTRTDAAGTQTYLTDAQDSTLALTNTAGQVGASYTYDPFGKATSDQSADPNAIRYTGRPSTPDIPGDLQYNRARFYSPTLHRFASQDPLGLAIGDSNLYAYAAGDPADLTDPSGLDPLIPIACGVGAILRDLVGGLANKKHTFADYAKGAAWGCIDGATLAAGAPGLRSARVAAREAEAGATRGAVGAAERGAAEKAGVPRSTRAPCNCFPAGTTVATASGPKRIEDIKVGDQVVARDLTTGRNELRRVTGLFHKQANELLTITAAGQQLDVTPQHPFWVPDRGWIDAAHLRPGDHLLRRDGTQLTITKITRTHRPVTVYNFAVEGDHNYYATPLDVLVHNCRVGSEAPGPRVNRDFEFPGAGRSGAGVKNFVGPPNSIVKGATEGRVFVTDGQGRVVLDITKDRVKPVTPGVGYVRGAGRKLTPTQQQLAWIDQLWGGT